MQKSDLPLRPTHVEIDLGVLAANLQAIRQKVSPAKVMPVVKANAYGHGIIPVAEHMAANGADMLGVAILDEGVLLRQAGLKLPILVLGGIQPYQIPAYLDNDLLLTIGSLENLKAVSAVADQRGITACVHVKIDTGMSRLGVPFYEAQAFLESSLAYPNVKITGIYTHFANSDAPDLSFARLQLDRFHEVLRFFEQHGLPRPLTHAANSGAILQLPESYFDLVRPGVMLYGIYPDKDIPHTVAVQHALTWKTMPVNSKIQPANYPVSYGLTWQSDHPVRILTLPVGYADGYFRRLSNQGQVLVRGQKYAIAGRVCMDQFMVNLENAEATTQDEVILLGRQGDQEISAEDLAEQVGTIAYEILTNISARVPRVYVNK